LGWFYLKGKSPLKSVFLRRTTLRRQTTVLLT